MENVYFKLVDKEKSLPNYENEIWLMSKPGFTFAKFYEKYFFPFFRHLMQIKQILVALKFYHEHVGLCKTMSYQCKISRILAVGVTQLVEQLLSTAKRGRKWPIKKICRIQNFLLT